jgi:hypothetical protein
MVAPRPDLARFAAAAFAAAALLPVCGHAAGPSVHVQPLQSLSPSNPERTLDWRGRRAKATFDLPSNVDAQNLRIVLDAVPGDVAPTPDSWISVRLNGSDAAILRPEPYPFVAQVDFPAQDLRPGRNVAIIEFVSPAAACPAPSDGGWALDLGASRIELTAGQPELASIADLDVLLRSELLSPDRVAIAATNARPEERAAFQVWAAMAVGVRAYDTPRFVSEEAQADLVIRYVADPNAQTASFQFPEAGMATLEIHASSMEDAVALLRQHTESADDQARFTLPVLDDSWAPAPVHSVFRLERRPTQATLRVDMRRADTAAESIVQIALNGHVLPERETSDRLAAPLPPGLLVPGLNRLDFSVEARPAEDVALCPPSDSRPPLRLEAMRVEQDAGDAPSDLFSFAAGDFGDDAHLVLPIAGDGDRAAQLRLLADVARRAGQAPDIATISETMPEVAANTVLIAPRATIPASLLSAAPISLHAILRGERPDRSRFRFGSRAMAAGLEIGEVRGAAAHFAPPGAAGGRITLVTEAAGADFAATLNRLTDAGMLAAFDGLVMRWTRDDADVQDRGAWRAPALRVPPPTGGELQRTALFLAMIGLLSLGWGMARTRNNDR